MTLVLAAVSTDTIVVAADGALFSHSSDGQSCITAWDDRKLMVLPERRLVLAFIGQNLVVEVGSGLDTQRRVDEVAQEAIGTIDGPKKIDDIATILLDQLSPSVNHTFRLLQDHGIHLAPLAIALYGFDANSEPKCYEVTWPMLSRGGPPTITKLEAPRPGVFTTQGGTGTPLALHAIHLFKDRCGLRTKGKVTVKRLQQHVRDIYCVALGLQGSSTEFGGKYHEFTVRRSRCFESTPTDDNWTDRSPKMLQKAIEWLRTVCSASSRL